MRLIGRIIVWLACALTTEVSAGQPAIRYAPLKSYDPVPASFLSTQSANTLTLQEYYIRNLMLSGKVLFNDSLGNYLHDVLATLLPQSGNKRPIEIYSVKSAAINSFISPTGQIFITTGLIARLQNEAELAFVLARELAHFQLKHEINFYVGVERRETNTSAPISLGEDAENLLLSRSFFSRRQEMQADTYALVTFLRSGYSPEGLEQVFDRFKQPQAPYGHRAFDFSLIESDRLKIPAAYYNGSIERNDEGEENSTQPGLTARRAALAAMLSERKEAPGNGHKVSPERFNRFRALCRFSLNAQYYAGRKYLQAFYNTSSLLADYGDDSFARHHFSRSLYAMSKYRATAMRNEVVEAANQIYGPFQAVLRFFDNAQGKELTAVALNYIYRQYKLSPGSQEYEAWWKDLILTMKSRYYNSAEEFRRSLMSDSTLQIVGNTSITGQLRNNFLGTTLYEFRNDGKFNAVVDSIYNAETISPDMYSSNSTLHRKKSKPKSVVLVKPAYYDVNYKQNRINYKRAQAGKQRMMPRIMKISAAINFPVTILDNEKARGNDAAVYNDLSTLNDFYNEVAGNDGVYLSIHLTPEIQSIVKRYGTSFFAWPSVTHYSGLPYVQGSNQCWEFCCIASPITAVAFVTQRQQTVINSLTYNLATGTRYAETILNYDLKDRSDVIWNSLYVVLKDIQE